MRLGALGLSFGLGALGLASVFEPAVAMRGMFSYMADAAVFQDCGTGRKLPVAMEGDYLALERAYLKERAEPGQGETIQFGRTGGTLMACPEAVRDREFVAALGKAATWRILGTHLELRSKDGTLLARFEAAHSR